MYLNKYLRSSLTLCLGLALGGFPLATRGQEGPAPNEPPSVTLTSPKDGSELPVLVDLLIKAEFSDPDGSVVNVKFPNTADATMDSTGVNNAYELADAVSLGNGWYEMKIPMSDYDYISTAVEFAIIGYGTDQFYVTDIYFD